TRASPINAGLHTFFVRRFGKPAVAGILRVCRRIIQRNSASKQTIDALARDSVSRPQGIPPHLAALVVVRTARRRLQFRDPKEARYGVRSEREWNATYHRCGPANAIAVGDPRSRRPDGHEVQLRHRA